MLTACQSAEPLEYFKPGTSRESSLVDAKICGSVVVEGQPFYLRQNLPEIDKCLRAKGYKVDIAPKIEWSKEGVAPQEEIKDLLECGGGYNTITQEATVEVSLSPGVDACMRKKGYRTDAP